MDFILDWQLGLSFELARWNRQFYSNSFLFCIFHLWISLLIFSFKCTLQTFNWNANRHLLSSLKLFFYWPLPHFPSLKSFHSRTLAVTPYVLVALSPWKGNCILPCVCVMNTSILSALVKGQSLSSLHILLIVTSYYVLIHSYHRPYFVDWYPLS